MTLTQTSDVKKSADLVEFLSLSGPYNVQNLRQIFEMSTDSVQPDDDEKIENTVTDVIGEISRRIKVLGCLYPFQIKGNFVKVKNGISFAGHVYIFSLIASYAGKGDGLIERSAFVDSNLKNIREKYWEFISAIACAGLIDGVSFLTGTSNKGNMEDKMKELLDILDLEGVRLESSDPGNSPSDKDCGVDAISWRNNNSIRHKHNFCLLQATVRKDVIGKIISTDRAKAFFKYAKGFPATDNYLRVISVPHHVKNRTQIECQGNSTVLDRERVIVYIPSPDTISDRIVNADNSECNKIKAEIENLIEKFKNEVVAPSLSV